MFGIDELSGVGFPGRGGVTGTAFGDEFVARVVGGRE